MHPHGESGRGDSFLLSTEFCHLPLQLQSCPLLSSSLQTPLGWWSQQSSAKRSPGAAMGGMCTAEPEQSAVMVMVQHLLQFQPEPSAVPRAECHLRAHFAP